ncbi:alpha/beta fold hydrolase [Dactylosporangium sp. NPDC000555]|uniref:alpha/beta fold hydrolase n=1 Tax=Dactylosporangium sp. NPDC000555 TaxID=3154260 RepID=UPI00331E01C9
MTDTHTIVLLGGSGLGPWAWQRVIPVLDARGFRTLAPQLRATGEDATPAAKVSLGDWIDDITGFLADHELSDVTLVAHSFAGYVAAGALARDAGAIRTAVFLDAVLPQPGTSWFEVMGPGVEQYMTGLAIDGAIPWFTGEQLDQVYPGHGISNDDFAWMRSKLTPQPIATYAEPAIAEPLETTRAKLAYVRCLRTTPPAADIAEDSPGWTFRALDAGHWPMITHPDATARAIEELARR